MAEGKEKKQLLFEPDKLKEVARTRGIVAKVQGKTKVFHSGKELNEFLKNLKSPEKVVYSMEIPPEFQKELEQGVLKFRGDSGVIVDAEGSAVIRGHASFKEQVQKGFSPKELLSVISDMVGQAQMAEINQKVESIQRSVDEVSHKQDVGKKSELLGITKNLMKDFEHMDDPNVKVRVSVSTIPKLRELIEYHGDFLDEELKESLRNRGDFTDFLMDYFIGWLQDSKKIPSADLKYVEKWIQKYATHFSSYAYATLALQLCEEKTGEAKCSMEDVLEHLKKKEVKAVEKLAFFSDYIMKNQDDFSGCLAAMKKVSPEMSQVMDRQLLGSFAQVETIKDVQLKLELKTNDVQKLLED